MTTPIHQPKSAPVKQTGTGKTRMVVNSFVIPSGIPACVSSVGQASLPRTVQTRQNSERNSDRQVSTVVSVHSNHVGLIGCELVSLFTDIIQGSVHKNVLRFFTHAKYLVWTIISAHAKNNVDRVECREQPRPPPPSRSVGTVNKPPMFLLMYKHIVMCVFCRGSFTNPNRDFE